MTIARMMLLAGLPLLLAAQTLETVKQEQNLTRRSQRALEFAEREMTRAQGIVREFGSKTELQEALRKVVEGSELALQALRETGRPPRRLSSHYKRGELKTRDFLKKLEDLGKALSLDDRPIAEEAHKRVFDVHEDFLAGVMGQQKK
jgi:hypothetical protein